MEQLLQAILAETFQTEITDATPEQLYHALLRLMKQTQQEALQPKDTTRKLYYFSSEFLIGKLLSNNLINLGLYDEVKELLSRNGQDLSLVEEAEPEPSLGNGGLGRLAACFLDSIATLGLPGDGVGLNYHFGLFQQTFEENKQKESPNPWIEDESWLNKTDISFTVPFSDFSLKSTLYDIDITGYGKSDKATTNKLHLFDVETVDETLLKEEDSINFDKKDIAHNLTLFLYPDDSDKEGQLLRIYQQYFMVSNGAQYILMEAEANGYDLHELDKHVVIQINDTHPTLVIPELIRLLTEKGIDMDEAIGIVSRICAYTNHTILAEALETWPVDFLTQVVPHLMPIIEDLDSRIKEQNEDEKLAIIDKNNLVHMAHIDIHYGFSVNGVAALHTDILKKSELKHFYDIYPNKFNNKTNGITFRRWLLHCNPELTGLLEEWIGDSFKQDATQLEKLLQYKNDDTLLESLQQLKENKKLELKDYLMQTQGIELDDGSIFDIQIKRLHEYKRQQMNCLYAIRKYLDIKDGRYPRRPITLIFGAKAAPAYTIAKDIIHLILCLQDLINNDPQVKPWLQVVMIENYNVTKAEKLIPACDISEQISLASKEASGTGNMKFMLNGAVTLGTMDGANVEIHDLVGRENIYIFGRCSQDVIDLYEAKTYEASEYYNGDKEIEELIDFILNKKLLSIGDPVCLARLYKELTRKDWFMTLPDLKEYIAVKDRAFADYENSKQWSKKVLVNIAHAGFFSSDRTIEQYNNDIWHL